MKEDESKYPVFATTSEPPNCFCKKDGVDINCSYHINRLYLMDVDSIELKVCDCIYYDLNGNPNCSVHKGKLQEFYGGRQILTTGTKYGVNHISDKGKPFCNQTSHRHPWNVKTGKITCSPCLKKELRTRMDTIERERKDSKPFYFEVAEFNVGDLKNLK